MLKTERKLNMEHKNVYKIQINYSSNVQKPCVASGYHTGQVVLCIQFNILLFKYKYYIIPYFMQQIFSQIHYSSKIPLLMDISNYNVPSCITMY